MANDRWQSALLESSDAVFLLNRQKRILFVNPAWESLTGLTLGEVRGLVCKRHARNAAATSEQELQTILLPPPEVLSGASAEVRRAGPLHGKFRWWDIAFMPLRQAEQVVAIIGRITPAPVTEGVPLQPVPESIMMVRQRYWANFSLETASAVPARRRAHEQARLAARTDVAVVLVGEAGVGKSWLARAIHRLSAGRELPFVRLECQRLSPLVLSDGIFGERGLLRRQALGTVYLHNPAALPHDLQALLAGLLRMEEATPRFISGFDAPFAADLQAGRLLPELFTALGPLVIDVPPLRDCRADMPALVEAGLRRNIGSVKRMSTEALQLLTAHSWPGNLHELFETLQLAETRTTTDVIEVGDLPFYLRTAPTPAERSLPLDALLEEVEKRLLTLALRLTRNNKTKAAEMLSIWRPRLLRRLAALGFEVDDEA